MQKKYNYIMLGIALIIFIILILMVSPFTNIEQIEFYGLNRLEESQIIRELGLDKETNLLAFNKITAKKILKQNYYIKSVTIKKQFPNKIIFEISERDIVGYIAYLSDYLYIDKDGFIVDIKPNYTEKLPLITGLKFDNFALGQTLDIDDKETFSVILKFTNSFYGKDILDDIFKIDVSDLDDIHIYIGKIDVIIGDCNNINIKINTLIEIINSVNIDEKGFLYLDDINSNPVFKFMT